MEDAEGRSDDFLAMDVLTTFLLSKTSQGEEPLDTGGSRVPVPGFSPSMPLLVFWPLLALRRRQCFSLWALAVCGVRVVCHEREREKKKQETIDYVYILRIYK